MEVCVRKYVLACTPLTSCWEVGYMSKMFVSTQTPFELKNVTKIFYTKLKKLDSWNVYLVL